MKRLILLLFFLSSCASYVNELQRDIEREENLQRPRPPINTFEQYRKNQAGNPRQSLTSKYVKKLDPSVKRQYVSNNRVKADDLTDNDAVGSLWAGSGNDSYLFTKNTEKQLGDIVVINIFKKFKDEIVLELKRAFPDPAKDLKDKKEGEQPAAATPPPPPAETDNTKPIDRISSVIIEEINQDHLLLRGRKTLLFKRRKRLVEVQALVARKDIADDDSVSSNKILESSVHVLR